MTYPQHQDEEVVDMFAWESAKFTRQQAESEVSGEFDEIADALEGVYDDQAHDEDTFAYRVMLRIVDEDRKE